MEQGGRVLWTIRVQFLIKPYLGCIRQSAYDVTEGKMFREAKDGYVIAATPGGVPGIDIPGARCC